MLTSTPLDPAGCLLCSELVRRPLPLPFGLKARHCSCMGRRICLDEGIARNELFLFFTTILQNFSVASPVAPEDIDLTPQECGVGKIPPTYQIRFLPR
ncbi:cytochrome P450 2B6-like [Macaca fascicularis]|uniref:cytochrome P450 2B6-like n=1 Tax=Macaca fascicularis TaxID=9541 RepID=UPI0032B02513